MRKTKTDEKINPNERNWSRIWRDVWITIGTIAFANLLGFAVICFHKIDDKITPLFWALACLASGGIIGFLFGIPRVLQDNNISVASPKTNEENRAADNLGQSSYRMQVNTNLEQISDWLTKIIVGVGLIELRRLPEVLTSISTFLAKGVDGTFQTQVLASTVIVYFTMVGFLGTYLMTRIYLAQAFSRADWGTQNTVNIAGHELTQEEFHEQQRDQFVDLREQVFKLQAKVEKPRDEKTTRKKHSVEVKTKIKSILWVDDNPKNNSLLVSQLEEKGVEVVQVLSTFAALEVLKTRSFDIIISDMGRNEIGQYNKRAGLDLLEKINERTEKIPVIFYCNEKTAAECEEEAIAAGAIAITASPSLLIKNLQVDS
jgi:CheY-like chemotaxis protein